MQWFDINKLHPETCKRFLIIFLLALIVMINVSSALYDVSNQKHSIETTKLSQQNQILLKQVNTNLQTMALALQQHKNASVRTLENMTAQLAVIQNALANLPTQDNFKQLEATVLQLNKNILAVNHTANQEHAAHPKVRAKRENHTQRHLARSALPFKVNSIDIWNGEPCATINTHGAPDLMTTGDTRLGWTLVNLSFSHSEAVFANRHHQLVKILIS